MPLLLTTYDFTLLAVFLWTIQILGLVFAAHVVMTGRTAQGAIAWSLSLVIFPLLALPAYLVFGRDRLHGYVEARRKGKHRINKLAENVRQNLADHAANAEGRVEFQRVLQRLASLPATRRNRLGLLTDGKPSFRSMFRDIRGAKDYILIEFYIIHDDRIGRMMARELIKKAREGVRIHFIYDEIGCLDLPDRYLERLRRAGIQVRSFNTMLGRRYRFQINFRNHRKMVIVDGRIAHTGGINLGDEYLGLDPKFGSWRDTQIRVEGPAVLCVQLCFLEDWFWAANEIPELNWTPHLAEGHDQPALVLPSGPADSLDTCALMFHQIIHAAHKRLWIATPYFVPDEPITDALRLAALRGVDVRVIIPARNDSLLIYLSSWSYLEDEHLPGLQFYRYHGGGFMHQKVALADDDIALVGTANLDNRSLRLNFELSVISTDKKFTSELAAMFEADFKHCKKLRSEDLRSRNLLFRIAVRVARLFAPIH